MTKLHSIAFAFVFGSIIAYAADPPSRHITLTYTCYLTNIPEKCEAGRLLDKAAKHPELRDYNFGTLSNIYLTLSHGRDVMLVPAQHGPQLNLFAEPYAEADGTAIQNVKWAATFQENN